MVKPHMSNPRARRAIRDRHTVVEREERLAARRARRANPHHGWHDDGDECIGPSCINPAHDEQ